MTENFSRRSLLKASLAGAGAFVNLNPRAMGANEQINLALIGGRNQGKGVALRHIKAGGRIATFCDLDEEILEKVGPVFEKAQGVKPAYEREFQRVLDDKNIDAVIIATPDHWHTHMGLLACQAGKDVYIEKPLSQTIAEGQMLREAARKYNRIMQVGTQRRSGEHFRSAAEYVASGKLGKVCLVKAWMCQMRKSIGNPPDSAPPSTVNYDKWLGPAPLRPFNPNRFHYTWRFFWDYGNTELGNQGVHMLDVALMGIQHLKKQEHVLPKHISGHGGIYWLDDAKEVPDTQVLTYDFGDLLLSWELRSFGEADPVDGTAAGTGFYGTEGSLILDGDGWKVYDRKNQVTDKMDGTHLLHEANFLECVKSRKRPNADVEIGRLSTTLCHLGNICQRLGRDIRFDPETETFPGDADATARLTKQYREGYALPNV
ncbi:MAG: Gfo/Idh/MocA family oxidoreductase [Acidobacteria bacterium]|nr:Gfo/Idh/MocA family oxidoreductase [Acidobacteriota bacterium]